MDLLINAVFFWQTVTKTCYVISSCEVSEPVVMKRTQKVDKLTNYNLLFESRLITASA